MKGRLIVKGGRVVTVEGTAVADVLIEDDRIGCVAAPGALAGKKGSRELDATGCFITPGGIDVHTHLDHQVGPDLRTADDFFSGTLAAAVGGTTTIVDFAPAHGNTSLIKALLDRQAAAREGAVVDYSFHSAVTAAGLVHGPADMAAVVDAGVTSFKVYMAYPGRMMSDDSTLLQVMRAAADLGCIVLVHAENGHMVADCTRALIERGETAEHLHARAHPAAAEAEAIHRAVALASMVGCDLYIVHVSSSEGAAEVAAAQGSGARVWAETCPQYLFTAYEDYANTGFDAAKYVCSPPIRERANQAALWKAIEQRAIEVISTDHAPFLFGRRASGDPSDKERGKSLFPNIPNGVPGVEERLKLLLQFGVNEGRISLPRFVELTATRPAKLMGLSPRKGTLCVGADADITVWDPSAPHKLMAEQQRTNADYSLYEGLEVSWRPRFVISRGDVLVDEDHVNASAGRGHFLSREPLRRTMRVKKGAT